MHRLSKPAERFINPSAAGIPTIGDAHHVSNVEIVAGAARRGAGTSFMSQRERALSYNGISEQIVCQTTWILLG